MKLVIDCFKQVKGMGKSIGIYNLTLNLVKNLALFNQKKSLYNKEPMDIVVIGNPLNREDFDIFGVHFICIEKYNPKNKVHCVFWELFAISYLLKRINADKVLFPRGYCALSHPVKDTIIIHDMIPFYYKDNFPKSINKIENLYITHRLKESAKTCNSIITISEASKVEIIKYCKVPENKITVIYNGCNEIKYKNEKFIDEEPYICAVTSALPHKNAVGIFESYLKYCEISEKPMNIKVIGVSDVTGVNIPEDIRRKITCYRYIDSDSKLHSIIANSKLFLFLSLIEGFGFPPIEAMQLGIPVICSNLSSLPEVVGDAAILVNPNMPNEVADAIIKIENDDVLRDSLVKKGKENIKRFSWDNCINKYCKILSQ